MIYVKSRPLPLRFAMLACALSFGFVAASPLVASTAFAQDKAKKDAPKGPSVSPKLGKVLKAAQDAITAKNWREAKAKIDEAAAFPDKSAYETYAINELSGFVAVNSNDYAGAAKSFEATLNSEFLTADAKPARLKAVSQLFYQVKAYNKTTIFGPQYLKDNSGDSEMHMMVGQAYYLQNDFPNASKFLKNAIEGAEKADKPVKEDWLQLLQSSEYEQNNIPGLIKVLEKTVRIYPKASYWDQLITLLAKEINRIDDIVAARDAWIRAGEATEDFADAAAWGCLPRFRRNAHGEGNFSRTARPRGWRQAVQAERGSFPGPRPWSSSGL